MGDLTTNFSRWEFACKDGCGFDTVDYALLTQLQTGRTIASVKFSVNSGCRCHTYNKLKRGATNSQHMFGRAADIWSPYMTPFELYTLFEELKDGTGGLILYDDFIHVDTRSSSPYRANKTTGV
jgi:uncharacterized protein YcbK (DUF882 family)